MNLDHLRQQHKHLLTTQKDKDATTRAWLRLIRTENVGPVTFFKLLERYGTAQKALDILPQLSKNGGRTKPLNAPSTASIDTEIKALKKMSGQIITALDPAYPTALAAINDAPPVLSAIGNLNLLNDNCIAIIGARNASAHGQKYAEHLARALGHYKHTIVSGLARGIDTAAHKGALTSGTIAVLASGLDVIYPKENTALYNTMIRENGLILTEAPLGTTPQARHFPRRNRIVSGLSKGVVVIEATLKSGSLITAKMAGDQGRDVFAVPGSPGDPRSSGPNALIKDGATLVEKPEDIIDHLRMFRPTSLLDSANDTANFTPPAHMPLPTITNAMRDAVLEAMTVHPTDVNELIRTCGLSVPLTQTILLELELAGRIQRVTGNQVVLAEMNEACDMLNG